MSQALRIALVQQHATRDREENLGRALVAIAEAAAKGARLVCFAELAGEWFYPQKPAAGDGAEPPMTPPADVVAALAEEIPGPTTRRLMAAAAKHRVIIIFNLYEREGNRFYDTSPVISEHGELLGRTRMIHITDFPCFHERGFYHPGDAGAPVYDTSIGRIGVAICYDRHFPEVMRALGLKRAELVLVPQAGALGEWPEGLYEAELRVAAFQNGYFAALCNRVGEEECLTFAGESFICAPDGRVIAQAPKLSDHLLFADLDLSLNAASCARRLFLPDRRPGLYREWFA